MNEWLNEVTVSCCSNSANALYQHIHHHDSLRYNSVSPVYSACFIIRTYLNLDTFESRADIRGKCWNVVMEKISWTDSMKNEELHRVKEEMNR